MAARWLVIIGWLYVAVLMTAAEAAAPNGSLLGAAFTFVLYGLGPLALVLYLMGTPARKRRRALAEAAAPDQRDQAAGDAVAPEREEP